MYCNNIIIMLEYQIINTNNCLSPPTLDLVYNLLCCVDIVIF